MKSPHVLVSFLSFFLMVGIARAVPTMNMDQRSGPPASQGRGQSAKPATPPPSAPAAASQPKGSQTAAQHLQQQPQLSAKLQPLLPPGTDLQVAAVGFKNLGEFVAAVHVSQNLGIPFDQLKTRLTGSNSVSLGAAIKELRPAANASVEVKKAETQAKKDREGL